MKWIKEDKSKVTKFERNYGDKKIKKHFCLLPKTYYDSINCATIYYWLETVYLVYEWVEGKSYIGYDGFYRCKPAHWKRIGLATSYANVVIGLWG